jgi:tRNA nucleotidyltransferase (CCA-adding enzyme)
MVAGRLSSRDVSVKDLDLEVYGVDPGELHTLVEQHFPVDVTGASFAVLKAHVRGASQPIDISVPRRERATGEGHRDFEISADPSLTFVQAAYRRDFTIGAMGYDPLTGELVDPYGGAADLASGVLRHVSPAFVEDPLRALRAARFAARFGLTVHPDTVALCRTLRNQAMALPTERRWGELEMTLAQAATPGRALYVLDEIEWIDVFAELAALRGVEQDPGWHPEGDVFTHTAEVLNYWGTNLRTGDRGDDLVVSIAAMCHDFGKTTTTHVREGRLTSHGHEEAGIEPASALLRSLGQVHLANDVAPLIAHHLAPVMLLRNDASDRALRRLSVKVPRLDLLTLVAKADQGGRPPKDPSEAIAECDRFYERVQSLDLSHGAPANLARGEDLIALGMEPGPVFKELLGAVYDAQLDGEVTTSEQARALLSRLVEARSA